MKKYFLMLAAALMLIASCAKDEVTHTAQVGDYNGEVTAALVSYDYDSEYDMTSVTLIVLLDGTSVSLDTQTGTAMSFYLSAAGNVEELPVGTFRYGQTTGDVVLQLGQFLRFTETDSETSAVNSGALTISSVSSTEYSLSFNGTANPLRADDTIDTGITQTFKFSYTGPVATDAAAVSHIKRYVKRF